MPGKPYIVSLECEPIDLQTWVPEDPTNVMVAMVLEMGWEGEQGTTLFYFRVATPEALKLITGSAPNIPIISYRALIVMSLFSLSALESAVERIVSAAPKDDMDKCFTYLSRYFQWEFEDTDPIQD